MKVLHIIYNDKFIKPFIEFIEKNFPNYEHRFLFLDGNDENSFPIPHANNIINIHNQYPGIKNSFKLSKIIKPYIENADKVILHSLFSTDLVFYLYSHQRYLKKCYWVLWGGDLYASIQKPNSLKNKLKRHIKSKVIQKMGAIITYIKEGDYEIAQKYFHTQAKCYESFFYLSNLYEPYNIQPKEHTTVNIQVGNSADPTNNHIEVFELLEKYKDDDIKIIVPLSYSSPENAKKVIDVGEEMFGEKFQPLTEFMAFDEYLEFLGEIDIAIFNHNRQQAMGNITTLLGLGKKVYVRSGETPWKMFKKLDLKIYDTRTGISLEKLDDTTKRENQEKVKTYFSKENLYAQWKTILEN